MPLWTQHLLVLTLVAGCIAWVAWQVIKTLGGRRAKVGSCCATGCRTSESAAQKLGAAAPAPKVVFLPVESLTARARKSR